MRLRKNGASSSASKSSSSSARPVIAVASAHFGQCVKIRNRAHAAGRLPFDVGIAAQCLGVKREVGAGHRAVAFDISAKNVSQPRRSESVQCLPERGSGLYLPAVRHAARVLVCIQSHVEGQRNRVGPKTPQPHLHLVGLHHCSAANHDSCDACMQQRIDCARIANATANLQLHRRRCGQPDNDVAVDLPAVPSPVEIDDMQPARTEPAIALHEYRWLNVVACFRGKIAAQ